MKQIILGDIHGRTVWKDIVTKHPDADRFIFIGDYVDTHEDITGGQQLENLADICEFKKSNKDKVILLILIAYQSNIFLVLMDNLTSK